MTKLVPNHNIYLPAYTVYVPSREWRNIITREENLMPNGKTALLCTIKNGNLFKRRLKNCVLTTCKKE